MPISSSESTASLTLAIDSERIIGALIDAEGHLHDFQASSTPVTTSQDEMLNAIITLAEQVITGTPYHLIHGVGGVISAPVASGKILPTSQLEALRDIDLANILQTEIGLPAAIENDINAMALAEAYLGNGQGVPSLFYIFIDTYLNGAIIQDGKIWHGMHANAGEIGHLVADWMGPRPVTLGQRASGIGIAAEYNMRSRKHRTPTLDEIIQYAHQGDHLAIRVIRDGARILGSVISPVMDLLDPALVVVGGRFAHSGDLWWSNFVTAFNTSGMVRPVKPRLIRAKFDEDATLQGASLIATHAVRSLD